MTDGLKILIAGLLVVASLPGQDEEPAAAIPEVSESDSKGKSFRGLEENLASKRPTRVAVAVVKE